MLATGLNRVCVWYRGGGRGKKGGQGGRGPLEGAAPRVPCCVCLAARYLLLRGRLPRGAGLAGAPAAPAVGRVKAGWL